MAGDWIKMRHDLPDDPAVIALCDRLGLDADTVVGKLHRLWTWADKHTTDGFARGITPAWVDRHVRSKGFSDSLIFVGWVNFSDEGIEFLNFNRHNGDSAKKRATNTARQKVSRNARDKSATEARQLRDRSATRVEEKRVENNADPKPKTCAASPLVFPAVLDTPEFHRAWSDYEANRREAGHAKLTSRGREAKLKELAEWGHDLAVRSIRETISNGWQGLFRPKEFGNAGKSNVGGSGWGNQAAERRAAKAAREYPEPDIELPTISFGGDSGADDPEWPTGPSPNGKP